MHLLLYDYLGQRDLQRHPGPFRKTQWSEKRGLLWNRVIVTLIGIFLLVFGLLYQLKGDAWSYLLVTGTIYLASISTC